MIPFRRRLLCAALVLHVIPIVTISGCRDYPRVATAEAQVLIQKFYTACNTKNDDRLNDCKKTFETLKAANRLTPGEIEGFEKIISLATDDQWSSAANEAMRFAEDQVSAW